MALGGFINKYEAGVIAVLLTGTAYIGYKTTAYVFARATRDREDLDHNPRPHKNFWFFPPLPEKKETKLSRPIDKELPENRERKVLREIAAGDPPTRERRHDPRLIKDTDVQIQRR